MDRPHRGKQGRRFPSGRIPALLSLSSARLWLSSAGAVGPEREPDQANPSTFMRLCIYPGTFDPITYGHLDVLERATRLFDRVLVSVAHNPDKKPLFSPEQRVELLKPNIARFPNVTVTTFSTLLVDFAMEQGAVAIIRGLRAMSDFEFEFNMALMNRHLQPAVETIYVMPNEDYSYTSSHLVKQVSKYGGDVTKFVPANVAAALRTAYGFK
jgi:pantetheine-phosphate adenylyltransferase